MDLFKNTKQKKLNAETALLLAGFCYQTYPFYIEGRLTLPKGFKLRYTIRAVDDPDRPDESVLGFIAESKDKLVVAFRGYINYPEDLIASYDIFQVPYPYTNNAGNTSRGFTCTYQTVRNNLIRELKTRSRTKTLYITGHNYGGAFATLSGLDISVNTEFKDPIVYTFGSPRVGDTEFADRFDHEVTNSFRVANIHDSFPTFPDEVYPPPFTENGLVYRHVAAKYPLSFQYNNTPRNDAIECYFNSLAQLEPEFARTLCSRNPGFCPETCTCFPFQDGCKCSVLNP
jgi:triacylglycerol lipase